MKTRVNWTLDKDCVELLQEVMKQTPARSISALVEHAILHTYQDPLVALREKARDLQREFMVTKDRIDAIEAERKRARSEEEYRELRKTPMVKEVRS